MILLWGVEGEPPLGRVRDELQRLRVPTEVLDQRDVLETEVHLSVDAGINGWVRTPRQRIDLAAVTGVYLRPFDVRRLPAVSQAGSGSDAWRYAVAVEDALSCWADVTPALVVSRPSAMAANGSKPYQSERIRWHGFAVPETLLTTDPEAVRAFGEQHGAIIYKSISSRRSRVTRLRPEDAARLADVTWCPTQFQRYIPGREHRVHVVGEEIFACQVRSDADDYRYPGSHEVEIRACTLPGEVEDRCRRLAAAMDLPVAGIDLRHSPEGEWYCFEVNPMPGFTYYEDAAGQPIGAAIARLLAAGARRPHVLQAPSGPTRSFVPNE
ncbi:MAG: ATP-grasp domain-containing protein [Chloroflexota bacterium]